MGIVDRLNELADRGSLESIFSDGIKAIQERFAEERRQKERRDREFLAETARAADHGHAEIPQSRGDDARDADRPRPDGGRRDHERPQPRERSSGDRIPQSSADDRRYDHDRRDGRGRW